ncbi:hypothetical protein PG994_015383 [Apiospora phragmitis]|uniref:Uncharacterized protein n=1 Tax=Apiospora phragmitis TaxID=2905665 RepID=A0ABR1SRD2_9PEZI
MGYQSRPQHQPRPQSRSRIWDPDTILELKHPKKGVHSCTGYNKSRGNSRCMNSVGSFKHGFDILFTLANTKPAAAASSRSLKTAAIHTLCHLHQGQIDGTVHRWKLALEKIVVDQSQGRTNKASKQYWSSYSTPDNGKWRFEDKAGRKDPGNYAAVNQHFREKAQKEEEQRKAAEEERRKVAEEIRKARESARERLRLAQMEREQKLAAEWTEALSEYRMRWSDIKSRHPGQEMTGRNIPWPVKSGLLRDVNKNSVSEFVKKAMSSEDTAEKKFILINAETKKWHTDKVMQHFGRDMVEGEVHEELATVAKHLKSRAFHCTGYRQERGSGKHS